MTIQRATAAIEIVMHWFEKLQELLISALNREPRTSSLPLIRF
ncbi:MAG: hypothetical protein OFPII_34990 [Osedax symbiont Rs1]|nr:MAG: hypothetical protein OFPII_34990 [Osedax symbiont Rs1]